MNSCQPEVQMPFEFPVSASDFWVHDDVMDKKIDNEAVVFFDWVNIIANKCNSFLLDFVKELLSVFFTNVFLSYSIKDISLLNFSITPPL